MGPSGRVAKLGGGLFYLEKSGRFVYRFDNGDVIHSDGVTLRSYSRLGGKMEMHSTHAGAGPWEIAARLVLGGIQSSMKNIRLGYQDSSDTSWHLEGRLRDSTSPWSIVVVAVDKAALAARSLRCLDFVLFSGKAPEVVSIDFDEASPAPISPDLLHFTPPPGTTVVEVEPP